MTQLNVPTFSADHLQLGYQFAALHWLAQHFRHQSRWVTLVNLDWYPKASTCAFFGLPEQHILRTKLKNSQQLAQLIRSNAHQLLLVSGSDFASHPTERHALTKLAECHDCQLLWLNSAAAIAEQPAAVAPVSPAQPAAIWPNSRYDAQQSLH